MSSSPENDPADRRHWPTAKGSLREMEEDVPSLRDVTSIEERFAMMWQLAVDAWTLRGEPIRECRFPGSVGRVIRRGS